MTKDNEKSSNIVLLLLLLFSVLIRFFSHSPYFFISMDEGKYLKLAENIPRYVLYNNNFYISHPPLYPLVIKIFSFLTPAHIAGILVSQLSAFGFMLMGILLLKLLDTDSYNLNIIVAFLSISHLLYYWSNMIYKETFFAFLVYLFIFTFIISLIKRKKIFTVVASLTGLLLSFTSDLVIFLFPVIIFIVFLYGRGTFKNKQNISLLLPFIFILAGYTIWISGRWWIYNNNIYFPAGVDGLIEKVSDYRIIHLLTPRSFPWTKELTQSGFSLNPLHYIKYAGAFFNLLPPFHIASSSVTKKDVVIFLILYLPLIFILSSGIISSLRKKDKTGYLMLVIAFSFLSPVFFGISDPRFSIPVLLPTAYFIGTGMTRIKRLVNVLNISLVSFLALFTFLWLTSHPYFFGFSRSVVQLEKTSRFLNSLPEDGIMAQFGYPPEIAYLTNKRVICLPLNIEEFGEQIVSYDINYLVFDITESNGMLPENSYGADVINYIKRDTERFIEIKRVQEKYQSVRWQEKVYVYEVNK
jgi:hypothetical protein